MQIKVTLLGDPPRTFEHDGRLGWSMIQLAQAGAKGVTPIDHPAPRWSAYVHTLRKMGIQIETEMEPHEGTYPGLYARYRLYCDVKIRALDKVKDCT